MRSYVEIGPTPNGGGGTPAPAMQQGMRKMTESSGPRRRLTLLTLLTLLTALAASPTAAREAPEEPVPPYRDAVTVFGARMADNKWKEIATFDDVSFRDAYLAGIALSREIAGTENWALEIEGQTVKHAGAQTHWEFNAALVARWRGLPWKDTVPTSLAFGIGPSYATSVPSEEVARDGESARLLLYWVAEVEVGLPDQPWSGIARLHHRSNAYGVVADNGGSNWITLGVRRRF